MIANKSSGHKLFIYIYIYIYICIYIIGLYSMGLFT